MGPWMGYGIWVAFWYGQQPVSEYPGLLFGMGMIGEVRSTSATLQSSYFTIELLYNRVTLQCPTQADRQTFADYCATIVAQIEAGRMVPPPSSPPWSCSFHCFIVIIITVRVRG